MDKLEMPTRYDASLAEGKWYSAWESAGLFAPSEETDKGHYTITIPPPNITGSLHMGHALVYSVQDALGRFNRLLGKSVLILPGQDHAGIATQSVVDKQLRKEGSSAAQVGRDKFIERVWEWRKESGDTIIHQFRTLGCAFDWSRLRFTLDEQYAEAVLKVFIDWFERGLIFRGKRVVNWDPKLQTSVSDIETVRETRRGKLYHVRYRFEDGSGEIIVATTRPETMLGDVAIAVHPSDTRYRGQIGKYLILPLVGRRIPLIEDIYPDPAFGTGAVKITPAHDPNDYQVGIRHSLEMPVILDPQAKIALEGPYFGLDRNEARRAILKDLEESGALAAVEDHEIPIVISDRSGEVIEPLLSEQWFCDQPALAKRAIEAAESGEIRFFPERYRRIFLDWMLNIREWCISRQLWWGHRIPIYYAEDGTAFAALSWDDAQAKAGDQKIVRQDDDVLDTWFSSGLWPFATLGWPERTADLERFYPTDCLVTDRNIINLWVARMIMMGYDLAGARPFDHVAITATVMREDGKRMSKSLGTGIDPMEVIQAVGADALRWTLLSQSGENQEIRYAERKTEDARNLANKIWNATRFVLLNVSEPPEEPESLEPIDRWLLSRLSQTITRVDAAYRQYNFQEACQEMHRFFWSSVCDWYLEICKSRLQHEHSRAIPQWVLLRCVQEFLVLLHPIMPHLSEELYSYLPLARKAPFLMAAEWPSGHEKFLFPEVEAEIERIFAITVSLRALRAELDLPAMKTIPLAYISQPLGYGEAIVRTQAWIAEIRVGEPEGEPALPAKAEGLSLAIPITGLVDTVKLLADLDREETKVRAEYTQCEQRLQNPSFLERAKPEAVEKERLRLVELSAKIQTIADRRKLFS
jgi:valyl-tRNA synthetase